MANANAKFMADAILNWMKGSAVGTAFAVSNGTGDGTLATSWVGLFSTVPTANTGSGTEISGSSYARQSVTNASGWSAISQNADTIHDQISNSAAITFPAVTTSSYTVVGVGVWDALPQATPAAPSATGNTGTGSAFTASQTVNVAVSYVTPGGETVVSSNTLVTIGTSGNNVVVTLPTFPTGVTAMNVYASTASGGTTLNKNVASGQSSTTSAGTVTLTGFPATGVVVPASNTSGGNLLFYQAVTSQAVAVGNQYQFAAAALVLEI